MKHPVYLSSLFFAATLSQPLQAAERIPLNMTSMAVLQQNFQLVLPSSHQALTSSPDALHFVGQHIDKRSVKHIRMQQDYRGFPVFGGYAIIHRQDTARALLTSMKPVRVTGALYRGLDVELGEPDSAFVARSARALSKFKASVRGSASKISEEKVTPMVYLDEQHRAFWAYKVSVLRQEKGIIPARPTAIVDAKTGRILEQWNDVKTHREVVQGKGFGGNQQMGSYQYGVDYPLLELTRDPIMGICYMENEGVRVLDMHGDYAVFASTMSFPCGDVQANATKIFWTGYTGDGYDLQNGAYSPSNDALYIGSVINQMYSQWYGVPALTQGDKAMRLTMRVHYGVRYENAFWDGRQMTFGDGDMMMYPLVSLGIGAHEISHGFTEQHANLEYFGQSGGMNESFSDMAAQVAENFSRGVNGWSIGSEIMKPSVRRKALRYMDKPSRDGQSIDKASQYRKGMDVHYLSGVYNRLFYVLAHQSGWDVRRAFDVMLTANMDYWTPYSTFEEGACGALNAADDLGFAVDAVKLALDDVEINYQACV